MRGAQIAPDAVAKAQATRAPVLTCKYQVADRPQAIRRQEHPVGVQGLQLPVAIENHLQKGGAAV
jgi:hypothetical protein